MVPRSDLKELVQSNEMCRDFSLVCQKRVGLLEAYKSEADKLIDEQSRRNVKDKEELDRVNRRNNFLYPGLALLLGIVGGAVIQSR